MELLEKLLRDEIKARRATMWCRRKNTATGCWRPCASINRAIETAQVIEELIQMAKEFQAVLEREAALGLGQDEIAFYDALANNESAVRELGDDILKKIAIEITEKLRSSTTVDWQVRECSGVTANSGAALLAEMEVSASRTMRLSWYSSRRNRYRMSGRNESAQYDAYARQSVVRVF